MAGIATKKSSAAPAKKSVPAAVVVTADPKPVKKVASKKAAPTVAVPEPAFEEEDTKVVESIPPSPQLSKTVDYLFEATISHGNPIKVHFDLFEGILKRVNIRFTTSGIYIFQDNSTMVPAGHVANESKTEKGSILFEVSFPRDNFFKYECQRDFTLSINAKHAQKLTKNIKKKNIVKIYVPKPVLGKVEIRFDVIPEGQNDIQRLVVTAHEEISESDVGEPGAKVDPSQYHYPVCITPAGLQKIKRVASSLSDVHIYIQTDKYISVCGPPDIYASSFQNGQRVTNPKQISIPSNSEITVPKGTGYVDDPLIKETDPQFDISNYPLMTVSIYDSTYISHICKLCGLGKNVINIYQPMNPNFPLKIAARCELGECIVYIKNKAQIEYDKLHPE